MAEIKKLLSPTNVELYPLTKPEAVLDGTDPITNGNTHTGAILQRKYVGLDQVQFDAPEGELATGVYEDNLTYFTKDGSTITLLVKGTDYNIGDAITGTVYKCSVYDVGHTRGNIYLYGYNRYRDSAVRQYLNSNAITGAWWTSTHIGDNAPAQLNSVRGYKAGCSASILQYAKPCGQICKNGSEISGVGTDIVCDLFWLPSGVQIYGTYNSDEGIYFKYWKDATGLSNPSNSSNAGRIVYHIANHSNAVSYRIRSVVGSVSTDNAWYIFTDGGFNYYGWYVSISAFKYTPCCAIY